MSRDEIEKSPDDVMCQFYKDTYALGEQKQNALQRLREQIAPHPVTGELTVDDVAKYFNIKKSMAYGILEKLVAEGKMKKRRVRPPDKLVHCNAYHWVDEQSKNDIRDVVD